MNSELYQNIADYIKHNKTSVEVTEEEKKRIKRLSKHYILKNEQLFKLNKRRKYLKVIRDFEVNPLLYMLHNHPTGGHFGIDKIIGKIQEKYYWPQYFQDVKEYIKACDSC